MNVICKIYYKSGIASPVSIYKYDIMCGLSNTEIIERSLKDFKENSYKCIIYKIEVYTE